MVEEDKKKEYIIQREEFKEKKKNLLNKILEHESEIKNLHKQINGARPVTENGELICNYCDTQSMKYIGRTPQGGLAGGDDIYKCEICERDNFD
ncbi:MAG: hypothetical protein KKB62_03045 [Nanoarchaeota archaeon]|nr:hypothetical protein [Nanoarchaeota archaeon]